MTSSHDQFIEIAVTVQERVLYRPERTSMLISIADWDSLMARIASCKLSLQLRILAASVAFAIGITAGLSIIPIAFAQLPIWVLIAYISATAFGLGIGIGLVIAARGDWRSQQSNIDTLLADMAKRRAPFTTPTPETQPEANLP